MGCVGAGSAHEKGGKGACYGMTRRREGGGPVGEQQRQPVGNDSGMPATDGRAWALKIEEVGALPCGPHGTVLVGRVKRHSIDLKINLN
jgi:hypothetical protein